MAQSPPRARLSARNYLMALAIRPPQVLLERRESARVRRPRRRTRDRRQYLSGAVGQHPHRPMALVHEPLFDRGIEQRQQRVKVAAGIEQHDRPEKDAEPLERDGLQKLLERAGST